MRQISTNKLGSRKHVEIDGHYFIVRRMGAGDQLTISQYMRELQVMAKKEQSKTLSDEDYKRIGEIEQAVLDISARCFDDQGDGSKSKELIKSLTQEELTEVMETIFNEKPEVS